MQFNYIFQIDDLKIQFTNIKQALDEMHLQYSGVFQSLESMGRAEQMNCQPQLAILNDQTKEEDYKDGSGNWIILDGSIDPYKPNLKIEKSCPISKEDHVILVAFANEHNYAIVNC